MARWVKVVDGGDPDIEEPVISGQGKVHEDDGDQDDTGAWDEHGRDLEHDQDLTDHDVGREDGEKDCRTEVENRLNLLSVKDLEFGGLVFCLVD